VGQPVKGALKSAHRLSFGMPPPPGSGAVASNAEGPDRFDPSMQKPTPFSSGMCLCLWQAIAAYIQ